VSRRAKRSVAAATSQSRQKNALAVWCNVSMLFVFGACGVLVFMSVHDNAVYGLTLAGLMLVGAAAAFVACMVVAHVVHMRKLKPLADIAHQVTALRAAPLAIRVSEVGATGDLRELVRAINKRLEFAQLAVQSERDIVDDLAHELRTSLTAQILSAEVALLCNDKAQDLPAQAEDVVCTMLAEARHMDRLITGLLNLARLRVRRDVVQLQSVNVLDVAKSCVQMMQALAEEKDQSLSVLGHGQPMAYAEPTMLRQSLMSIVHNAIDHCPPGAVICVRVGVSAHRKPGVEICVEDNGPGIPVEQRDKIFERLVRGRGGFRKDRGLGLGLAIAKAMTQGQGGSIRVDSQTGKGTKFVLTFCTVATALKPRPSLFQQRSRNPQAKSVVSRPAAPTA
jgi:two-component system, OmpR family, sensor kinase